MKAGNVTVATNTLTQGSGNHKITDFWLYVNGQFQGSYALGNLMPIVPDAGNRARISIYAGIKNNGFESTRIPWQFYERYDFDTTLTSLGGSIQRDFAFRYNSSTVFAWSENFDLPGFKIIKSAISVADFTTTSQGDNLEGKSLVLSTTTPSSVAQVESSASYTLPTGSSNVYLEFNYKSNCEFSVGLIGSDNAIRPVLYVRAQENWNKIYVPMAQAVNLSPISTAYKVYFRMPKTDNVSEAKMFLDNIKLVYL